MNDQKYITITIILTMKNSQQFGCRFGSGPKGWNQYPKGIGSISDHAILDLKDKNELKL